MPPHVLILAFLALLQLPHCPHASTPPLPFPSNTTAPRKLLFAAELCRHGDRTPLQSFPTDPLPLSKWPEGIGQLTSLGMRAHYALGARLRARYVDTTRLLSPSYTRDELHVRSTDIDRTLMSAASQLVGLYPPGTEANYDVRVRFGADVLHENEGGLPHLFQPVPVHTVEGGLDPMLIPGKACPRHDVLAERKKRSPEYVAVVEREKAFLKQAAVVAGWNRSEEFTLVQLEKLLDNWRCFQAHSVPLPENATDDVVAHARNLSNWLGAFNNEGLEIQRLRAGLILYNVNKFMAAAFLKHKDRLPEDYKSIARKFLLLSAHDTTVAAALAALRVFDGNNPPYNSTLIWELFEEHDEALTVRLEYNGKPLRLPGCSDEYCPVGEYLESTKERTVHGVAAREIECLVGWRRQMAMVTSPFTRSKDDALLGGFGLPDDRSRQGSHVAVVLCSVIALAVALFGAVAFLRLRSRYRGYAPAASDFKKDDYGLRQGVASVAEQRILM